MTDGLQPVPESRSEPVAARPVPLRKAIWRRVREPLARSVAVKHAVAWLVYGLMRLVDKTNPRVAGSDDPARFLEASAPAIFAFWHGQHLMYPALKPGKDPMVALFSKSADAELNAMVGEKFGIKVVRGSGGRDRHKANEKGGARALIALKKALDQGNSVAMIADIPHGTPREAGRGIVLLARISGRPIVAAAYATSRRKVIEKSWDKTTINLPFGRGAVVIGDPIHVAPDASDEDIEAKRRVVSDLLNAATEKAYRMVDGQS